MSRFGQQATNFASIEYDIPLIQSQCLGHLVGMYATLYMMGFLNGEKVSQGLSLTCHAFANGDTVLRAKLVRAAAWFVRQIAKERKEEDEKSPGTRN